MMIFQAVEPRGKHAFGRAHAKPLKNHRRPFIATAKRTHNDALLTFHVAAHILRVHIYGNAAIGAGMPRDQPVVVVTHLASHNFRTEFRRHFIVNHWKLSYFMSVEQAKTQAKAE